MTVSTANSQNISQGNGSTTLFNFSFAANSSTPIRVFTISPTGVITDVTGLCTINYNAVGEDQPWSDGGTVAYNPSNVPLPTGWLLWVRRILPFTQEVSLENQDAFYPSAVDLGLDLQAMLTQQLLANSGIARGVWVTGTTYNPGDIVVDGVNGNNTGNTYSCALGNVSTTWAADLAAGDWSFQQNLASQTALATAVASAQAAAAVCSATGTGTVGTASPTTGITGMLYLKQGASPQTITFPAGSNWSNAVVPNLVNANANYVIIFQSIDGGATWQHTLQLEAYA